MGNRLKKNVPVLRFPKFDSDWELITIEESAKYRRGSFPQPYGLDKWYDNDNGDPFVQVYDVDTNMRLKPDTKSKISEDAKPFSVFVPKNSIVLTIQGSIGRIAITQYDCYVDRTLLIFGEFLRDLDEYFFAYRTHLRSNPETRSLAASWFSSFSGRKRFC